MWRLTDRSAPAGAPTWRGWRDRRYAGAGSRVPTSGGRAAAGWDRREATPELAELYAESTAVELPLARQGGLRLMGREQVAQHFAGARRAPFRLTPTHVTLHETTDPEVSSPSTTTGSRCSRPGRPFWSPACRSCEYGTGSSSPRATSTTTERWLQLPVASKSRHLVRQMIVCGDKIQASPQGHPRPADVRLSAHAWPITTLGPKAHQVRAGDR